MSPPPIAEEETQRTILQVCDQDGFMKTTTVDVLRVFTEHVQHKCDRISTSEENMGRLLDSRLKAIPEGVNSAVEEPIKMDELSNTIKQGKPHEAHGRDGI
jgi:hypothetical protein